MIEGFDETGTLKYVQHGAAGGRRKVDRLSGGFCLTAGRFHKLDETQISFSISRNAKEDGIFTTKCAIDLGV